MNSSKWAVLIGMILLPAGCSDWHKPEIARNDRRLVASLTDEQAVMAVQRQRTVYPYHFIAGTAELNDLGRRDLMILADFERDHPGVVHVCRDREAPGLYAARLKSIREFLSGEGVPVGRVMFDDAWPGGDGERADAVAQSMMRMSAPPPAPIGLEIAPVPIGPPTSGDYNN